MRLDALPIATLLRLAGPVALARLGIMGMGLVDVIVVGQLAPQELPYQALALAPPSVLLVTSIGLLTGVQVLSARAIGEGRPEHAGDALRKGLALSAWVGGGIALLVALLGGRIFSALGIGPDLAGPSGEVMQVFALSLPFHLAYVATAFFLESIQRPMASTVVMWIANIANLVLNLAFVPEYGALGSAWATVGSRVFLAGALIFWVLRMPEAAKYGLRGRGGGVSYGSLMRIGSAAAVSHAVEAGAFSWMTIIAGRVSGEAVAAYQILLNVLALVFMIALGLSTATAVLTAEAAGRNDRASAARASWTGLGVNTIAMIAFAVVLLLLPHAIARAYTADLAIAALIAGLMPIAAAILAPDGGQVVAASALRARGDNWFPTASHILAYAIIMPGLATYWGEVQGHGVAGIMWAIFIGSVVSVAVLAGRLLALTARRTARAAPAQ